LLSEPRLQTKMASPEKDVRKLQVSLALAAKALLECEENGEKKVSTTPFEFANLLGYEGEHNDYPKLRDFLVVFWRDHQGNRV
jgi:hypothetical protein